MGMSEKKQPPVLKLRNWCQFCTGGLLTTGGLGWCLRLAYKEEPKAAMASYFAGSAGVCLLNMAIIKRPGTKDSGIPIRNWLMMLTGGILVSSGFGYCLTSILKEHQKSTIIAYTAASLGYCIMSKTVLDTMCGVNEKATKSRSPKLTNKQIAEIVDSANARLHYMGGANQCAFCKAHVEKAMRARKEAEGRSTAMNVMVRVISFLRNLRKICLPMGRTKHQDSLAAEKTSSRGGLKREISKTCQGKNIKKEQSDPREIESVSTCAPDPRTSTVPRGMSLRRGPAPVYVYDCRKPKTVPNKSPDEKSTQTESRRIIMATQTEESYLTSLKETAKEEQTTIDSQSDGEDDELVEEAALVEGPIFDAQQVLEFVRKVKENAQRQDLLEVPPENQQLELEDKQ